jgi:hypothetical protein
MIQEYRYEDSFIPSKADYVVKQTQMDDIKADLSWLAQACKGIKVNLDKRTLVVTSKADYFEDKHEQFKELAEKLSTISLEDFMSTKKEFDFYDLKSTYEDKHSFYIDDNDEYCGLVSLDKWIRYAKENEVYYIGSIFDYHY